jgi:glycosyltransferase involved in cell wall biosynthesis
MTGPAEDRPLVTFALFTYNQEEHIREAVEGAFAQTYEPLEIILSDDFSSDRTFEILQEMAASYEGTHKLKIRRSPINVGTALHVATVAAEMSGILLVVAAGDDISRRDRTEKIVNAWIENGRDEVSALHSSMTLMMPGGHRKARHLKQSKQTTTDLNWFLKKKYNPMHGPTCAYHRKIFDQFRPLLGGSLIEDAPLMLRAIVTGKVVAIDEPIVFQRYVKDSTGRNHNIYNPERWNKFIHSKLTQRVNVLLDLGGKSTVTTKQKKTLEKMLIKEIRKLGKLYISSSSPKTLFSKTFTAISIFRNTPRQKNRLRAVYGAMRASFKNEPKALMMLKKVIKRQNR